jgi:hypothetical protein
MKMVGDNFLDFFSHLHRFFLVSASPKQQCEPYPEIKGYGLKASLKPKLSSRLTRAKAAETRRNVIRVAGLLQLCVRLKYCEWPFSHQLDIRSYVL